MMPMGRTRQSGSRTTKNSDDVMPRGSKPGERRGGRTRATPNRRTILADRIVAVLGGCSRASPKECLSKLINDAELPADIRMAVAQRAFPDRTEEVRRARRSKAEIRAPSAASPPPETMSQAERDALLSIVSGAAAPAKAPRKAAAKLAAYFLPKQPVNKRWWFTADECGFAINGEIAREYRTIVFELRELKRHPNRDFPEIAQRIRKLQARIDAILQRLQCPCPSRYGEEQFSKDMIRLSDLARKREAGIALSTDEDAEEVHRKARFDCYVEGPERTARRYRQDLEGADQRFRKGRFFKVGMTPPLSLKERNDLSLLRWLYPPPHRDSHLSVDAEALADGERWGGHPFYDEKPAADGNYYPHDSKLRPAIDDECIIIDDEEYVAPRYCICNSGQPVIFTDELPIDLPNDKSAPTQPSGDTAQYLGRRAQ
jgi:hypothetical protein